MSRLFGTDGVRGVANVDLTSELALQSRRFLSVRILVLRGICLKRHLRQGFVRSDVTFFR